MEAIKKLAFNFGDKILLGLFLCWSLYQIAISISEMGGTPKPIDEAEKAIEYVEKSNPPAPDATEYELIEDFKDGKVWVLDEFSPQRESLYYVRRKVDRSVKQRAFMELKDSHECHFVYLPDGSGVQRCIFQGCAKLIDAKAEMIGLASDFKIEEVTVMTVKLSWNEPTDFNKVKLNYFLLERKKEGEEEWSLIKNDQDEPLKIGLRYSQEMPVFEDAIPELQGGPGGVPGGFPTGFPGDIPPGEFFPGEFFPEEFGFPGAFPGEVPQQPKPKAAEPEGSSNRRNVNAGSRKVELGEGVKTDAQFSYLDYNLDPNKTYEYRIKSVGLSANLMEIESAWSEPLVAKTEQDKSMRFVKYIPGLRDKDGKLIKKPDGSYVSPDKVYIAVSQLFNPPWSPQRYFIEYEHKGIIPGVEGSDGVGREVSNYNVLTADGNPVYWDDVNKFLYVHSTITEAQVEQELKTNSKLWKRYRVKRDFTLPWKVVDVTEEVKEEEVVKETFDAAGRPVEKVEVIKTYHYFAELINRVTKETDRLELERDNPQVRILKF